MKKIAIFGVGLMGGSLALCFRGKPGLKVVGHSNNPDSVKKYLASGVVDEATTSMEEAATDADVIFLCVPVGKLDEYLNKLKDLPLKPGCIITDVGSTKASVNACAEKLQWKDVYFIGGHPMAGSERSGVEAANVDLYENAFYVLTPTAATPPEVYEQLVELLSYTRAQIVRVEPLLHDDIVGAISHLPHIVAVALVNQIAHYNSDNHLYALLAAGGFRDITRIASSEPIIWRDILLNNREVLLRLLADWNAEIAKFIRMLEEEDGDGVEGEFARAREFRNRIPERKKGILSPLYELYVDIPDHPGIIGQITTLLGQYRINVSNIRINESRVDVPGVLRLSFRKQEDLDNAKSLLQQNYKVHVIE